jgi:hypothetical protein
MLRLILAAALLLALAPQSGAQTLTKRLRGVSSMDLLIELLDKDSVACGVSKEIVKNAVLFVTSSTRLKLKDDINGNGSTPLYVNVTSLRLPQGCVSVVRLEADAYVNVTILGQVTDKSVI